MLALVDNQPKVLNLYEMLNYYLIHQEEVVTRRTKYDLNKAEERAHILQGLINQHLIISMKLSTLSAAARTPRKQKTA